MAAQAFILVVDDELDLRDNISLALEAAGYQVLTARDGIEALDVLETAAVDLILADIAMPKMNGYQLYERVRSNPLWMTIPFIFLTARKMDSDIRYGKELGVDDYLLKPIHSADLLAVVRGKMRRMQQLLTSASSPAPEPRQLVVGQLLVSPDQHRTWLNEHEIQLSAREFTLLAYMARRPDTLISAQELVQITHDLDTDPVEAGTLIRPLIRSLRRKLGYPVGDTGCIEAVRGVGYRLKAPDM